MTRRLFAFMRSFSWVVMLLCVTAWLCGCGYTLRGKVVRGETSAVEIVHEIDPRYKVSGINGAEVIVRRDPKSINPEMVGRDRSGSEGEFTIRIGEFGAGWMEEEWLVQARLTGFQNASALTKFPEKGSKWRLLITLAPGTAAPLDAREEIQQDIEKFK